MGTMMMLYRRRASPKHRYDIIEVDSSGGGTAHGYEINDQLLCLWGAPLPPYIKEQGGFGRPRGEARQEESYSYRE